MAIEKRAAAKAVFAALLCVFGFALIIWGFVKHPVDTLLVCVILFVIFVFYLLWRFFYELFVE